MYLGVLATKPERRRKTAASTNEGASSRQGRSSWKAGQIRGGYVGIQRGMAAK